MEKQVAYSLLELKAVDQQKREITGVASTPTPDRVGDVVEPMGMVMRTKDIKLHLYHDHEKPVGTVTFGKPTPKGVPYTANLPVVVEEGEVKERVDEAWHSLIYNLISGVSIGFVPIPGEVEVLGTGGLRFLKWEVLELSLTSVPANPEAIARVSKAMREGSLSAKEFRSVFKIGGAIPLIKQGASRPGTVKLLKPSA